MPEQTLILTLRMDEKSRAFFDAQRKLYFPPERNFLQAHLLMFHQLPDDPATYHFLEGITLKTFELRISGLMNLGAGVAYRVESEELNTLHGFVSRNFKQVLIPQDRLGFRPHITVMNKRSPEEARQLLTRLEADFQPFNATALGLDLWTYLGGPWRHEQTFAFI